MSSETYDVAVVGAGPAGATAAIALAQKEHRVALVDRQPFPRTATSISWLNVRIKPLLAELGVRGKALLNRPFRKVTFHDADFAKSAEPQFEGVTGYVVDRGDFGNALVEAAVKHGVALIEGAAVTDLQLKETCAVLKLADGAQVESTLLVLASGREAEMLDRAGIAREGGASAMWVTQIGTALDAPADLRVEIVLGLDKVGSFGLCCVANDRVSVVVNWIGERAEAVPALVRLCRAGFAHQVIPVDLAEHARATEVVRSPASVALDMDTHVGKHTLVIGDAGGFVSAVSNEGIYPAMWSAQIAAEVADTALKSAHSQDELMAFDSSWRMQMADYLRAPNTDSQFLLPLIFSNQPMADRMGAAFFSGENI